MMSRPAKKTVRPYRATLIDRVAGAKEILAHAEQHLQALRRNHQGATDAGAIPRAIARITNAEKRLAAARAELAAAEAHQQSSRSANAP